MTAPLTELVYATIKVMAIGDAGTGKSCILKRFVEDKYSVHTIGVEFGTKIVSLGGKWVKLQIWDTAGQEKFRAVTKNYYRSACVVMLVYDIANRETYNNVAMWLTDARDLAPPYAIIMLVGNKSDLESERQVTFLEASRFAQENDLLFLETSAKTGDGVEDLFLKAARSVLSKAESGAIPLSVIGAGPPPEMLTPVVSESAARSAGRSACKC